MEKKKNTKVTTKNTKSKNSKKESKKVTKKKHTNQKKRVRAFTLIELVVAVAILGVITLIAIPTVKMIRDNNKDAKYEAYEKALIGSAKLYVDGYNEDLFGATNTGCAVIYYEDLKEKDLIENIQVKNSICNNDPTDKTYTYVVVHKTENNNYAYDANVTCRDKNTNEVIYGSKSPVNVENICKLEDGSAPKLTIKDYSDYANNKFYQKNQLPNIKVKITEEGIGLKENQTLKYKWYKNGSPIGSEQTLYFKNSNYDNETVFRPITNHTNMDNNSDDTLYQVVLSGTIEDLDNNQTTHTYSDKVWSYTIKYLGTDKCTGYIVKKADGTNATASGWFNGTLKVGSTFKTNTIPELADLNVTSYAMYQSINNGSFSLLKDNMQPGGTLADAGTTAEGNIKFKASYKIDGLASPIDCPVSAASYNMDHKNPTVLSWTKGSIESASTYLYATGKASDASGGSGVKYYAVSTSSTAPSSGWADIGSNAANNTVSVGVARKSTSAAGKFYYYVKDAAGNVARSSNTVTQYKVCHYTSYMRDAAVYKMTFKSNNCGNKRKIMNIYNYKCYGYRDKYLNVYCSHTMTTKSSEINYGHSGNKTYIYYDSKSHCNQSIATGNTYVKKICTDGDFKADASHPERFVINHGGSGIEYQYHGYRFFTKGCTNSKFCNFNSFLGVWVHQPVSASAPAQYDASHTSSTASEACAKEFKSMSTNYDSYS